MSDGVIVRDSQANMEELYKQFPHLRRRMPHQAQVGAFGPRPIDPNGRLPFEPEIEPPDYVPPAGQSTYRGSRAIMDEGTPAAVVRREYYSHAELVGGHPRIIHPEVLNKVDKSYINFDAGPISGPAPKQDDYFTQTEEGRRMIKQGKAFKPKQEPPQPGPREIIPPVPPKHHHHDPSVLPPMEKPWEPSSNDIVKVLGWNETNMKLMTEVSKRIGQCSEMLTKINSSHEEVDVDELMAALRYIDNAKFRQIFADIFQEEMKKYMDLSMEIQSYLSGTAVIEDTTPQEPAPSGDTQPSASEGNVTVVSADDTSSQDAPGSSLQPEEPAGQPADNSGEVTG